METTTKAQSAQKEKKNLDLAYELQKLVEEWQNRSFNHIQLNVVETMAKEQRSELFEFIKAPEMDVKEFISNYGCRDILIQYAEENDITIASMGDDELYEVENTLKAYSIDDEDFFQFVIDNHEKWDDYKDSQQSENYPMWNTIFEFKHEPGDKAIEAAEGAGFGIIEGMDDFNTSLFVSGCGYSFYGAHWIPMFLALPYNEKLRQKYAGVDYSMM